MTTTDHTPAATAGGAPFYPMPRDARCPFDPAPGLKDLQDRAALLRVRIWDGSTPWLVTRYEEGRALLADDRLSADRLKPGYPHWAPTGLARLEKLTPRFNSMDPPDHDDERRMLIKEFALRRMEQLRPRIQEIVDGRIDEMLAAGPPADFIEAFSLAVPSLVICELLGVPYQDRATFHRASSVFGSVSATAEEMVAATAELHAYLSELVDAKLENPGDDLLSRLATEQLAVGALSRRDVTDLAVLLLFAGHDTTANMISFGTVALLAHPDQLAMLRESDDPTFVANAVEELLRYLNVTHLGRRRVAKKDIEIAGVVIRAGEGVIIANELGNRDERAFPHPDRLDLGRAARHHVAFGYGVHQCLGQPLARVELQVVYPTLFRRIPTLRLAVPIDQLALREDAIVYGLRELPVEW
ncbi:MAG: cytochrome P450 [Microbacteriaceae bacterium]